MWFRIVAWRVACSTSASTRVPGGSVALQPDHLVVAHAIDVGDPRLVAVPADRAGVRDLAAALGIEGAFLELRQGHRRASFPASSSAAITAVSARSVS